MPENGADRRQHERWELFAQVRLRREGAVETLTVINISAGGILMRNDRNVEFSVGERVHIAFDIAELALKFAIGATVVRVVAPTAKKAVVAAMWTSSDATASAALAQLLWSLQR